MATPSGGRGSTRLLLPLSAGLLVGGLVAGVAFWLLSGLTEPLPVALRIAAIGIVGLAAVADEALGLGWRWPQNARQVPQAVRRRHPRGALLQFGFELGTGMRTHLTSKAPYPLVALLVAGALPLPAALAAGLGFGAGRALMPLTRALAVDSRAWDQRLAARDRLLRITATALTAASTIAIATIL